ncbi:MAG: hypothetical protein FD180_4755 [Planctomycetota bacterium]|nr:MAG: hypothetical protein FD180_4755 [Planctomycetota bacterium]
MHAEHAYSFRHALLRDAADPSARFARSGQSLV